MATVAAMEPGWNLGNTFDAIPDETSWGNPRTTRDLPRHVRAQGYNSIRIPVTWSNHHGPAPDHIIDAAWLNRIREVVDWSLAEGFYVMINLHHDSWQWINTYPRDSTTVLNRYRSLWTQLSTTFRDHSAKLVYESINEPQFAETSGDEQNYEVLHKLNAEFVEIVRQSGGNNATRLLVLPTLYTNAEQGRLDALIDTFEQLYNTMPAGTERAYLEITGAGHNYVGQPSTTLARTWIPWLKIFIDDDARYSQFLCPRADSAGIGQYRDTCPLISTPPPTPGPTPGPTTAGPTGPPTSTPPAGVSCTATYRTVNSWSGGYQGEMTVWAGSSAINGWTVRWTVDGGQTIGQVWNGTLATSGATATVRNAAWNGSLAASTSTTFGFIGSGTPTATPVTCSSP